MKILTHGGRAHLDDVMACALAMTKKKEGSYLNSVSCPLAIERREPTKDELEDPEVLCLDVGGRHEPEKGNFDHHQLPNDMVVSAMLLIARALITPNGFTMAQMCEAIYPWWMTAVDIDQHGPCQAAEASGLKYGEILPFIGPLAGIYLKMFEDQPTPEARGQFVYDTLTKAIDLKIEAYDHVLKNYTYDSIGDIDVYSFTECDPVLSKEASGIITGWQARNGGIAVYLAEPRSSGETWENTGLTITRLKDDQRVDFRRAKDHPAVKFVHSSGFLCSTKGRSMSDADEIIRLAIGKDGTTGARG